MKLRPKYSDVVLNLLVAIGISLVVNFSYVLLLIVDYRGEPSGPEKERIVRRSGEGRLSVVPDGHGYLVYDNGDSLYVSMSRIRRLGLADGDRIEADLLPPRNPRVPGAHPQLCTVRMRNGAEFDYGTIFNRPPAVQDLSMQLLFYLGMSFVMLSLLTATRRDYSAGRFARGCLWCIVIAAGLYCAAPVIDWHTGRIEPNFMSDRMFDYMLLLKFSFAVVVTMLYGRIYVLLSQRQAVELENEQLKNENLTTRYDMLMGQINPHFFFNSLNSLAMLVRERQDERALTYIDQLSYTFRYIIQNGQSSLMTLDEELQSAEAYSYLLKIRYEDKLFFDIDVAPELRRWRLPSLSLQPLIGNAVKHNTITRSRPLHVSIRTQGEWLEVSNPKIPRLTPEPSTGIGLENLRNRWRLVTGRDIEIIETDTEFAVRLPLQPPEQ